jgi:hypothetical protein
MPKYTLPERLRVLGLEQGAYVRWLSGRAVAHRKRDTKRAVKTGHEPPPLVKYQEAIHAAVSRCGAVCEYTGESLAWKTIGTWNNEAAQVGGAAYKRKFARMPTVDHVHGEDGRPLSLGDLRITSWELNDAKGDLSFDQFVALCRRIVAVAERGPAT